MINENKKNENKLQNIYGNIIDNQSFTDFSYNLNSPSLSFSHKEKKKE